ncbi:MAG: TIGR03943 family protein [Terrimicrobiaceae bacterium]
MSESIHRYGQAFILAIWGAVALAFVATGRVASYLHPSFHGWTLAAGIILLLMAGALVFLPSGEDDGCGGVCDEHNTSPRTGPFLVSGFILVVPLLAATAFSPSQFGAATVINRGIANNIADLPGFESSQFLPPDDTLPGEEPVPMEQGNYFLKNDAGQIIASPIDLLYAANMPEMRRDFDNRAVEVVGQFFPAQRNNPNGDRFSLLRMFVMCCAADARPVAVQVKALKAEDFPKMSWIKVTGTVTFPMEGGEHMPVIDASTVEPTEPPNETFIY